MRFARTAAEVHSRRWRRGNAVVRQIVQVPAVQCAWCCAAMSQEMVATDAVSHGICPKCFEKTAAEIRRDAE
jgi:hypothetical protein